MELPDLNWDWEEIALAMSWKIRPQGYVIFKRDLYTLPRERVLVEERRPTFIRLTWMTLAQADLLKDKARGREAASVSELQGRWTKIAVVTAWRFQQNGWLSKHDSVTLSVADGRAVPRSTMRLMCSGHRQGTEWRWLTLAEAQRIEAREREQEGRIILEGAKRVQ